MTRSVVSLALTVLIVVTASPRTSWAATGSKFSAWAQIWHDGPIPVIKYNDPSEFPDVLDVRQERQYIGPCNSIASLPGYALPGYCLEFEIFTTFAAANPGHLYIVGDEPNVPHNVPADEYVKYLHAFIVQMRAVDPTSRFSTAGFGEVAGTTAHVDYAQQVYNAYQTQYGGAPPITEWRFNLTSAPGWQTRINQAAAFAAGKGGAMTMTLQVINTPAGQEVAVLQPILEFTRNHAGVHGVTYWNYEQPSGNPDHLRLVEPLPPHALTAIGQLYASYASGPPSSSRNGLSSLDDFNGDGFADFADRHLPTGVFWAHVNTTSLSPGVNAFSATNWAQATSAPDGDWDVLVADFTGDGLADYADVHLPTSQVWVHRNRGDQSFDTAIWAHSSLTLGPKPEISADPARYEVLAGDVTGDGYADLLRRHLDTGLLWIFINQQFGGNSSFLLLSPGRAVARTKTGPDWRTILADFTGDGLPDYADQHLPSGTFWIHRNVGPGPLESAYHMDSIDWAIVPAAGGGNWQTIVGDFTGDGWVDYADLWRPTGTFWIHANNRNRTFVPPGSDSGIGHAQPGVDWRILGSR